MVRMSCVARGCGQSAIATRGKRRKHSKAHSEFTRHSFHREMCQNPLLTKTLCDLTGVESDLDLPGQLAIEHLVWPAEITQTLQQTQ